MMRRLNLPSSVTFFLLAILVQLTSIASYAADHASVLKKNNGHFSNNLSAPEWDSCLERWVGSIMLRQ